MSDSFNKLVFSWLSYFFIIFIGGLFYLHTLHYDFSYLDDNVWILDYQWWLKDIKNCLRAFTQPDLISEVFWRPVLNSSFILNGQISGTSLFGYRITNLLLHVVNGCFVFSLLKKLNLHKSLAFGFALIFAIHPALVSAVVWIPGRTDSLLGFFLFPSILFFLNYVKQSKKLFLFGHLFFLLMALFVKETAVGIPVFCLFYVVLNKKEKEFKKYWPLFLGWFLVVGGWFVARQMILLNGSHFKLGEALKSILENSSAIISYFGKVIFPVNLSVLPVVRDMTLWYGIVSIGMIGILLFLSDHKKIKQVLLGGIWFLAFLLPALVFSFLKHEYRLYVPMIGVFLILGEIDVLKKLADEKKIGVIIFMIVACVFVFFNVLHSKNYKNRMSFWKNAVDSSPHSPLAHRNLGAMYYLDVRLTEAKEEFQKSLDLNPSEAMAHNNIGLILFQKGNVKEAEQEYLSEIAVNPNYENVYYNLGILYNQTNRPQYAQWAWQKSIKLRPKQLKSYRALALFYFNRGELKKAGAYFSVLQRRGVVINPEILQVLFP